jgi:two-component system chemotaxis sensor kinase CheA
VSGGVFFSQFMDDYFSESEEHLTNLRRSLLKLEQSPSGPGAESAVRELLRALHTLKGLAGMVGFGDVEQVSHALEEWLRANGAPAVPPQGEVLEALFSGSSLLERCLSARRANEVAPDVEAELAPLFRRGAAARRGRLDAKAESPPPAPASPERTEWDFEFQPTVELARRGVGVESVRDRLEQLGEVVQAVPQVLPSGGVAFRFRVATDLEVAPPEAWRADGLTWTGGPVDRQQEGPASTEPARTGGGAGASARLSSANVVRVDLNKLDDLMRLVGELVISRGRLDSGLRDTAFSRAGALAALQDVNGAMERQLRDLRGALLRVRLVEVGEVFERLRYAVREVARESGREVELILEGESTEIDKLVVERMLEPLLHLVRNAVSHGIEPPDQRVLLGKPRAGRITLRAATAGERIVIRVADDGAGIATRRVEALARERGLHTAEDTLDEGALLDVLSTPGFSTREQADLASGRGVGMAVVRATVEGLGGELLLETEPGKGTRFTVELPLTLMIIDAVLIALADQVMAVPQPALLEVLPLEPSALVGFENNEAVLYRGGVLPIVRLRDLFGLGRDQERRSLTVLVVGTRGQPLGLVVDRVLGLREIVVRSLADPLVAVPGIAGATELGDGRVVLILDAASLARARRTRSSAGEAPITAAQGGA